MKNFSPATKRNRHKRWEGKKNRSTTHSVQKLQRELTTSRLGKDQLSAANCPARCSFCLLLFSGGARVSCRLSGGRTGTRSAAAHNVSPVHTLIMCSIVSDKLRYVQPGALDSCTSMRSSFKRPILSSYASQGILQEILDQI